MVVPLTNFLGKCTSFTDNVEKAVCPNKILKSSRKEDIIKKGGTSAHLQKRKENLSSLRKRQRNSRGIHEKRKITSNIAFCSVNYIYFTGLKTSTPFWILHVQSRINLEPLMFCTRCIRLLRDRTSVTGKTLRKRVGRLTTRSQVTPANMSTGNHSLQPVFVLSRRPATSYILTNLVFKQTLQQCGVVVRRTR